MIQLIQCDHNLLGTSEDVEKLKKSQSSRILLVSDSHGHSHVLRKVLLQYGKNCDAFAFCGDGAADLGSIFNEAAVNSELKEAIPPVAAFVQGNGDPSFYPVNFGTHSLIIPARQVLSASGVKIFITHGHREGVNFGLQQLEDTAKDADCEIAFYGHTHIPDCRHSRHFAIYNPGSLGIPRSGSPFSFAIITVTKKFSDGAFIKVERPESDSAEFSTYTPLFC